VEETKLFSNKFKVLKNRYFLAGFIIFLIFGAAGLLTYNMVFLYISLFSAVFLIMKAVELQADIKFISMAAIIFSLLLITFSPNPFRWFSIALVLSVFPYFKLKAELASVERENRGKLFEQEKKKEIVENELRNINKEMIGIKRNLERMRKLYEISRNMENIEDSREIAQKAIESLELVTQAKRLAFYRKTDMGYETVFFRGFSEKEAARLSEKWETGRKDKKFNFFELKAGNKRLGMIVFDSLEKRKQFTEAEVLIDQITLGYEKSLLYERVKELSRRDGLTGLYLRRYFMGRLKEEIKRARREKYKIAFAMADIDSFKKYNDNYGHPMGDKLLEDVSSIIKDNIYGSDFAGRYGGEEFCIYMPHAQKEGSENKMKKIIEQVREKTPVTISIGLSFFPKDAKSPEKLIETSDKALYKAKSSGKNCIKIY